MQILSLSQETKLSISEHQNEDERADKNERNLLGELVLFCISTLKLKWFAYLSLPAAVFD